MFRAKTPVTTMKLLVAMTTTMKMKTTMKTTMKKMSSKCQEKWRSGSRQSQAPARRRLI